MIRRFAVVMWWLGALSLLGAVVGFFSGFVAGDPGQKVAMAFGLAGVFSFLCLGCWTVAFILAGSFRRPPPLH